MLITANFQDFLNRDVEIIIPQKHGIYHSPSQNIDIIHPYLAIQWLNQGNIPS